MMIQRWEPLTDGVSLREAMDSLFAQSVVRPERSGSVAGAVGPRVLPVDLFERDSTYVIRAHVPGVKAEDVEISAEGETVSIKVHVPGEVEKEEARSQKWLAAELAYGDLMRVVTLPGAIDSAKIEAQVENGVLVLSVPKAEEAKPKKILVKSK